MRKRMFGLATVFVAGLIAGGGCPYPEPPKPQLSWLDVVDNTTGQVVNGQTVVLRHGQSRTFHMEGSPDLVPNLTLWQSLLRPDFVGHEYDVTANNTSGSPITYKVAVTGTNSHLVPQWFEVTFLPAEAPAQVEVDVDVNVFVATQVIKDQFFPCSWSFPGGQVVSCQRWSDPPNPSWDGNDSWDGRIRSFVCNVSGTQNLWIKLVLIDGRVITKTIVVVVVPPVLPPPPFCDPNGKWVDVKGKAPNGDFTSGTLNWQPEVAGGTVAVTFHWDIGPSIVSARFTQGPSKLAQLGDLKLVGYNEISDFLPVGVYPATITGVTCDSQTVAKTLIVNIQPRQVQPPQTQPAVSVDLKVNNQDGPITLTAGSSHQISVLASWGSANVPLGDPNPLRADWAWSGDKTPNGSQAITLIQGENVLRLETKAKDANGQPLAWDEVRVWVN